VAADGDLMVFVVHLIYISATKKSACRSNAIIVVDFGMVFGDYRLFESVSTHFGGKKTPTPTRRVLKKKFDFHFLAFGLAEKKHFFGIAGNLNQQRGI